MVATERTALATAVLAERSRDALVDRLTSIVESLDMSELLAFLADLILTSGADRDHLKAKLADMIAARFGQSSERSSSDQLVLFAEAVSRTQGADTSAQDEPAATVPEILKTTQADIDELVRARRTKHRAEQERRRAERDAAKAAAGVETQVPWPSHLPVREETVDVPDDVLACPDCAKERAVLRKETSWHIERKVSTEVVVTHRLVRACASHHGGPVIAPVPLKPVDKGHLGFDLAAYAIYLRFSHNLPIRRIVEIFAADGVPVTEAMLQTLYTVSASRLESVSLAICGCMRAAALVNLDDTPVLVLDKNHPKRRRQGRVWLALGDGKWAWFFATPDWTAKAAEKRLGKIKGTLQGDGYKAFDRMARERGIRLAGCMAHLRRKLRKAFLAHDPRAAEALGLVQGLYRVEELAKLRGLDAAEIVALRQRRSAPLMSALLAWGHTVAPSVELGSPLGQAWTYLDNQQAFLQTYLTDGRVSIDNNAAERGLRRITIGRKLWLFFGGDVTVERAALFAGVLTTARMHGAEELAYLSWLLREVARREWSVAHAVALLPDIWVARQKQKAEQGRAVEV